MSDYKVQDFSLEMKVGKGVQLMLSTETGETYTHAECSAPLPTLSLDSKDYSTTGLVTDSRTGRVCNAVTNYIVDPLQTLTRHGPSDPGPNGAE